jgi:hypothetical protein
MADPTKKVSVWSEPWSLFAILSLVTLFFGMRPFGGDSYLLLTDNCTQARAAFSMASMPSPERQEQLAISYQLYGREVMRTVHWAAALFMAKTIWEMVRSVELLSKTQRRVSKPS